MIKRLLIIAALSLSLTACGTSAKPAQQPAEQATEQTVSATNTCKATVTEVNGDTMTPPDDKGTLMNDLEYEISMGDCSDSHYKDRGYYYGDADGKYQYTICSGERSTGGYGINITGLDVSDSGTVIVTVSESSPAPDMMVTEAFTYPNCIITFSHELSDGIVIKSHSGTEFEYLGTD